MAPNGVKAKVRISRFVRADLPDNASARRIKRPIDGKSTTRPIAE